MSKITDIALLLTWYATGAFIFIGFTAMPIVWFKELLEALAY